MIDKKRDYGEIRNPFFLMVGTGRFELPTSTVSVCLSDFTVFFNTF